MNKQIKVTDTRMHEYKMILSDRSSASVQIPVAEGELMILGSMKNALHEVKMLLEKVWVEVIQPIVISRTEIIKKGEYHLSTDNKIAVAMQDYDPAEWRVFKILVLPNQFSSKHLQAIVVGKMNAGDKVLVECEPDLGHPPEGYYTHISTGKYSDDNPKIIKRDLSNPDKPLNYIVKLNFQEVVTLLKHEEKKYTREEIKEIVWSAVLTFQGSELQDRVSKEETMKWFEENVK